MIDKLQTEKVKNHLISYGFTDNALVDDLVDHISCKVESQMEKGTDFNSALKTSLDQVLPQHPIQLENDLKYLTTKKNIIMIKKLAFIGGYASAVCLCLAILFFSQSFLSSKRARLKGDALQFEYALTHPDGLGNWGTSREIDEMNYFFMQQSIKAYGQFNLAETLLLIAIIVFAISFLPYQFYWRYQKSLATLEHV